MTVDWHELFAFTVSPLELIIRGTAVYWFLFAIFRGVLRRDIGSMGIADVLLVVIVADASQNAMAGEYRSITDGVVLVLTIAAWNVFIDWVAYRLPITRRFLQPPELLLVRSGKINRRNLRKEWITEDELRAQLREHGVASLSEVRAAYMESDGAMSVLTYSKSTETGSGKKKIPGD
ncbi:MAG: DUF421 domain-containing protein [Betaproteobacteria bacterium]|nr:DUF421 domain-containing protein [Betaproteobacteria bacterium]